MLCKENKKNNTFTYGCSEFKSTSMKRHEETVDHKASLQAPELAADLVKSVHNSISEQDAAVIKGIQAVLWLAQNNVEISKFESLIQLLKQTGSTDLNSLKCNARVQYDSYYTASELINAVSEYIDTEMDVKIFKSPFVTVLADESTDRANKKRMTLNARIINPETVVPETIFLRDVEYEDGTGVGLTSVITGELKKRNINIVEKLIGFGSDGVTVMSGHDKGVKGLLMRLQPHLIHVHCMAHRLALCSSQAADSVPAIKSYQQWLTNIFYYFNQSSSREKELHNIQVVLEGPVLKYKEIHAVRWLSCYNAVDAVYRTIDPLISYFHQREAGKDPKAKGLLKYMGTTEFIFLTYMLMDSLTIVSKLCLSLQKSDLDVASAKVAIDNCLSDLEAYKNNEQLFPTHLQKYDTDVTRDEASHFEYKGHLLTDKHSNLPRIKSSFLNQLISNIKKRFPQKTILDAFFILGMRSINFERDPDVYGKDELEQLLSHFGEEKVHHGAVSPPILSKDVVRAQWAKAKQIVRSMKYPVDNFNNLWCLLGTYHRDEVDELIKLAFVAMILPLHTADCERTFSQQNKILTNFRSRLSSEHLDQLIRIRLYFKEGKEIPCEKVLNLWKCKKNRLLSVIFFRIFYSRI